MALATNPRPDSRLSHYAPFTLFNLRPYLPEPYNTSNYALSLYLTCLPFYIKHPSTFWDLRQSPQHALQDDVSGG